MCPERTLKYLARPARFELTTSAFGELWCMGKSPILCGFSAHKRLERNKNIRSLRGHSADGDRYSQQLPAGSRDGGGRRRGATSPCSWRGSRTPAKDPCAFASTRSRTYGAGCAE